MVIVHCRGGERDAAGHYLVERDGAVIRLAPEDRLVAHAGAASWREQRGLDARSIGITLATAGEGRGGVTFPLLQLAAVCDLCLEILSRHPVAAGHFIGLGDAAPDRSEAPGAGFDWEGLARNNVGLWPFGVPDLGTGGVVRDAASLREVRGALARVGYAVAPEGALDPALAAVLRAFQRHWRPEAVTGQADAGTVARLLAVARLG